MKGRLISRLGLCLGSMTLTGMATTWLLTSFGASGVGFWVGVLVIAGLGFPLGTWLGRLLLKPVHEIDTELERLLQGWREQRGIADEDGLSGLRKALDYITAYPLNKVEVLESERAKGTAILEYMTEGVIALDGQGYVILMNPSAQRILGVTYDQRERRTLLEVVRDKGLAEWVEICQALDVAEPCKREIEIHFASMRIIEVNAMPMSFSLKQRGFLLVLHDITELQRLEKVRAEFVANVSHELRTPLTAIKGYLETVLDETGLESDVHRRFLEIANSHAERMGRLINDLLNLSDIETGKVVLDTAPIILGNFVRDVSAMFEKDAAKKDVKLVNRVAPGLVVQADRDRLSQILVNLVDNALKYTPQGGTVSFLAAKTETNQIRVTVRDTGQGIPPNDLPRVTERFYRVDKARSREEGGTGLGLAIVKHLVQLHGGTLHIESEYGKGTTIEFLLPVAQFQPAC
ncbi:MAG: PAS domain S-box protein [Nitrospira sp. SB0675_bin_23]|nr:PAS domain S-box protein [Nitrospira sp. SB0667_bin_9]MYD30552.1 PAS domain S-box protein [Nitrospira sp. SB0661_bin_20]MYH02775.1 PAS domain S-box protein [Nitrospira sp. SB0675_bin_23]MYJ23487.1 PAS domain S-box protein [Nitrospira sp. SB0673_bin_12]